MKKKNTTSDDLTLRELWPHSRPNNSTNSSADWKRIGKDGSPPYHAHLIPPYRQGLLRSCVIRTVSPFIATSFLFLFGCSGGGGDGNEALTGKQTTYAIGGTVSGLTGSGLVLADGSDRKSITANGEFRFDTELPSGARYNISVATQPFGQRCSISNHDAIVGTSAVTSITVACSASLFTLGGPITNLAGSGLELQNSGGDNRIVEPQSTGFSFARTYTSGNTYNVTVLRHPSSPNQYCEATNNTGTFTNADVDSVAITCVGAMTATLTSPTINSVGVSRDTSPSLNFSASLNSSTATSANVSLRSIAGAHPMTVAANNQQLAITLARQLLPATNYAVEIGTGIRGTNGERLLSPTTFAFTTRDGQWQGRVLAEALDTRGVSAPQVAVGANGIGFAVWTAQTGDELNYSIYANRYEPGTGWGAAVPIELDAGNALGPQVAADGNGNAIAVWQQSDGTRTNLLASRYASGAWSAPLPIEANNNAAGSPQIAMNSSGNATVVWIQSDGTVNSLYANRYSNGTWSGPMLLEANNNASPRDHAVACNENDDVVVTWSQPDTFGGAENIQANRFTSANGWSGATPLQSFAGSAFFPSVALDSAGNAIVVWQQAGNIYANRFASNAGWGQASAISAATDGASIGRISFDAMGNGIAIWTQIIGTRLAAHVNRFSAVNGWGIPAPISDPTIGHVYGVQIIVDEAGNAIATWDQEWAAQPSLPRSAYASRYTPSTGWSSPALLETEDPSAVSVRIAMDRSGNAIAVWPQSDGTRNNVYSNRFQ